MADKRTLKFVMGIETKAFKSALSGVKKELQSFGNFIKSAFALGGITAFGKSMVQAGKDYEDAMARVQAVSNATSAEFEKMNDAARKFGRTTIYSATQAANALEYLTRNGMTATQATQSLGNVLKLAQANAIELSEAADMLTNVMNMFGLSVQDGERIVDVLSATASNTATNVSQLYQALVNAAPAAKVLNFSLEEVSAALGALAQRGVKAEMAGTQLRMALVKMADPKIIKKMNEMGIAINEQQMRSEGLTGTVKRLVDAQVSLSDLVGIFSQKGAVGIQQLVNSYDDLVEILGITENAAGTANRMFEQGVGSVRKELDILKNKWNEFLISVSAGGGVVKGFVRQLQNLIDNFKTVGGTVLNIASIVVPLLASNFGKMVRTFEIGFKQIQAGALATKVAIGNIIGVVATLAVWVGTALYGAWNRNNQAMREAKEQMADAESEASRLNTETEKLVSKLGPDTDKKTLAGTVKRLTEMFPDFSQAIKNAADEAKKTGNWEKFRDILREIAGLQGQILARDASVAMRNAAGEQLGTSLFNKYRKVPELGGSVLSQFSQHAYERFGNNFEMRDAYLKSIMMTIGKTIADAGGNLDSAAVSIKNYADALGMDTTKFNTTENVNKKSKGGGQLTGTITRDLAGNIWKELSPSNRELVQSIRKVTTTIDSVNGTIDNSGLTNHNEPETGTTTGHQSESLEGDAKTIKKAIDDYKDGVKALDNRLKEGAITQGEYDKELDKLEDNAWEAIAAVDKFRELLASFGSEGLDETLSREYKKNRKKETEEEAQKQKDKLSEYNFPYFGRDSQFDYSKTKPEIAKEEMDIAFNYKDALEKMVADLQEGIKNGDFNLVNEDAIRLLEYFRDRLEDASEQADTLKHKMIFAENIEKINKQIDDLNSKLSDSVKSLAQAFERAYDSIADIAEAFGNAIDEDVQEEWKKFFSIMNAGVQLFETMKTVLETVQIVQSLMAKKKAKDAAIEIGANAAVAMSEKEKAKASAEAAAAGAASSVANVPYLGPALAIGAIATVIGAILAATKGFAKGGVIGGNSYSGDKQVIRANSGEMILTRGDQATLFNAIKSGNLGGGKVEFEIRADKLVGAIQNYNTMKRG